MRRPSCPSEATRQLFAPLSPLLNAANGPGRSDRVQGMRRVCAHVVRSRDDRRQSVEKGGHLHRSNRQAGVVIPRTFLLATCGGRMQAAHDLGERVETGHARRGDPPGQYRVQRPPRPEVLDDEEIEVEVVRHERGANSWSDVADQLQRRHLPGDLRPVRSEPLRVRPQLLGDHRVGTRHSLDLAAGHGPRLDAADFEDGHVIAMGVPQDPFDGVLIDRARPHAASQAGEAALRWGRLFGSRFAEGRLRSRLMEREARRRHRRTCWLRRRREPCWPTSAAGRRRR